MEQTVQEKSTTFPAHTPVVIIAAFACVYAGYLLYNAPFFHFDRLPQFIQSTYNFVHNFYDIINMLAVSLLEIFREIAVRLILRRDSGKRRFLSVFISTLVMFLCLVVAIMGGMKIAEEAKERDWLHNIYKNECESSETDTLISAETADNSLNVYYVNIKYDPDQTPSKEVIAYRINDIKPENSAFYDYIKNPLSAIAQWLKHSEYLNYKMILEPIYQEPANTLVVIEEILVTQNGKPLIKQNSIDPQRISYGYLAEEMETNTFYPTPKGYLIDFQECDNRYVQWHNSDMVLVDETNTVYFEDWFIDNNTPFFLTARKLKGLLGERLPEFTDSELSITIKSLEYESEPMAVSPPLEMTTREGRILYHFVDGQNDFYFAINSLANGYKAIEKGSSEENNYRLLCELAIG